jgi:hypothetical protein
LVSVALGGVVAPYCAGDRNAYIGDAFAGVPRRMTYILAVLVPPLGLLVNGQPFAAMFNVALIVPCLIFGLIFHPLWLVPSLHAVVMVHMRREARRHREIVEAIERHGPPAGWGR